MLCRGVSGLPCTAVIKGLRVSALQIVGPGASVQQCVALSVIL
jgi:hypothetical protein